MHSKYFIYSKNQILKFRRNSKDLKNSKATLEIVNFRFNPDKKTESDLRMQFAKVGSIITMTLCHLNPSTHDILTWSCGADPPSDMEKSLL